MDLIYEALGDRPVAARAMKADPRTVYFNKKRSEISLRFPGYKQAKKPVISHVRAYTKSEKTSLDHGYWGE